MLLQRFVSKDPNPYLLPIAVPEMGPIRKYLSGYFLSSVVHDDSGLGVRFDRKYLSGYFLSRRMPPSDIFL